MTHAHVPEAEDAREKTDEATRPGRKRDHTRDPEILQAALEVLAESGYDGMTLDMVAARAKAGKATLYRRWPSKAELVLDAVACMKKSSSALEDLPDTGTLRGDLLAMIRPHSLEESEQKMQVMAGLVSMLARSPELVDAANAAIVQPRAAINRALLQRAKDRGEVAPDVDIEAIALISPSMVAYRNLMQRKPIDREFLVGIVDGIILPAAGIRSPVDS